MDGGSPGIHPMPEYRTVCSTETGCFCFLVMRPAAHSNNVLKLNPYTHVIQYIHLVRNTDLNYTSMKTGLLSSPTLLVGRKPSRTGTELVQNWSISAIMFMCSTQLPETEFCVEDVASQHLRSDAGDPLLDRRAFLRDREHQHGNQVELHVGRLVGLRLAVKPVRLERAEQQIEAPATPFGVWWGGGMSSMGEYHTKHAWGRGGECVCVARGFWGFGRGINQIANPTIASFRGIKTRRCSSRSGQRETKSIGPQEEGGAFP